MKKLLCSLLTLALTVSTLSALAIPAGASATADEPVLTVSADASSSGEDIIEFPDVIVDKNDKTVTPTDVSATDVTPTDAEPVSTENIRKLLVEKRSIPEIRDFIAAHPTDEITGNAVYKTAPVNQAPYSAGELSEALKQSAINYINTFRYIAGLDADVVCDDALGVKMQAATLLLAVNNKLTTTPAQPADVSDELYALGKDGAAHASFDSGNSSLNAAIRGWMSSSGDKLINTAGHRRLILNPAMSKTAFGCNGSYYGMYATEHSRESGYTRVAWPAQNTPIEMFSANDPWTVSIGEEVTDAKITVSSSNSIWRFEATPESRTISADGYSSINNAAYGQKGCIIFRPNGITVSSGEKYDVSIVYNGNLRLDYSVYFFDTELADINTISFNANGGKDAPVAIAKRVGTAVTIPTSTPSREGYIFLGWSESKDGSVEYKAGDKYTTDRSVTLYAVWKSTYDGLEAAEIERMSGDDRISTALAVSKAGFESAKTVILANGFNYPDALAGVTLARAANAPILLCKTNAINSAVIEEIKRLKAEKIYILGGKSAVNTYFDSYFIDKEIVKTVKRLDGANRFDTAVAIANELCSLTAKKPATVYLACAENFPDALAISPVAAIEGNPVLYISKKGAVNTVTAEFIKNNGCTRAVILGGEMAVSAEGLESVKKLGVEVERISGTDRYATALEICRKYNTLFTSSTVFLATGGNFPDALAGGAYAARIGAPVLLIDEGKIAEGAQDYAKERLTTKLIVLGGESAVSDNAVKQLIGTYVPAKTTIVTKSTNSTASTAATESTTTVPTKTTATASTTSADSNWNGKTVYLTFDDGPSKNTATILQALSDYNVKATFFVTYNPSYEKQYKAIVEQGHTLALHSYTHQYATIYASEDAYFTDLAKLESYVKKVTGVSPKYLRFPGGASNTISRKYCSGIMTTLTKKVESKGYRYYDWNVDSGDASSATMAAKSTIVSNVTKGIAGNKKDSMVLMHDAATKTSTAQALPEILEWLKANHYAVKAIDDNAGTFHQAVAN